MNKHKEQIIEKIVNREEIRGVPPNIPPDAKYKKDEWAHHEPDTGPDLKVGSKLIVQVGYSPIKGYMLGVVLDWHENESRYWNFSSKIIFQVIDVSQKELEPQIGRIRALDTWYHKSRWSGWGGFGHIIGIVPDVKWLDYGTRT